MFMQMMLITLCLLRPLLPNCRTMGPAIVSQQSTIHFRSTTTDYNDVLVDNTSTYDLIMMLRRTIIRVNMKFLTMRSISYSGSTNK